MIKESNNSVQTKEGNLILDSHKLSYHMDRVSAWESGERIAPVSVDMALTRACGAMCSFCYAMMQESQSRYPIKVKHALELLDDFAEIGVKSVSLVSDGESTLSKAYIPFIQHAAKLNIDVANATNAWEWEPEKIDQVLPHLTWVRFTCAAGTPEGYSKIMFKDETPLEDAGIVFSIFKITCPSFSASTTSKSLKDSNEEVWKDNFEVTNTYRVGAGQ